MHATALISLLTATVLITICSLSEARVLCKPCLNRIDCNEPPTNCQWGKTKDICNRIVCAKGPGDRCGGAFNILGNCGEGMMCVTSFLDKNVERCQGCSTLTLDCYPYTDI